MEQENLQVTGGDVLDSEKPASPSILADIASSFWQISGMGSSSCDPPSFRFAAKLVDQTRNFRLRDESPTSDADWFQPAVTNESPNRRRAERKSLRNAGHRQ